MQQVFILVNRLLVREPVTRKRKLSIRTYKVPLYSSIYPPSIHHRVSPSLHRSFHCPNAQESWSGVRELFPSAVTSLGPRRSQVVVPIHGTDPWTGHLQTAGRGSWYCVCVCVCVCACVRVLCVRMRACVCVLCMCVCGVCVCVCVL